MIFPFWLLENWIFYTFCRIFINPQFSLVKFDPSMFFKICWSVLKSIHPVSFSIRNIKKVNYFDYIFKRIKDIIFSGHSIIAVIVFKSGNMITLRRPGVNKIKLVKQDKGTHRRLIVKQTCGFLKVTSYTTNLLNICWKIV